MKRHFLLYTIIAAGMSLGAQAADQMELSIRDATRQCEKLIPEHCKSTTCPQFCEVSNKNRRDKEKVIAACKNECVERCVLKPIAGADDPKNRELDAQNRDQLFACIAQLRDPQGKKSGRRMQDWKELETPSWRKLMGR